MHLKSLRLQGFKTFARRTELTFSHGITAIVGPNGSGKSNLVDAIRWALGERNARGLRGHRMEDVIYSGGPGKSAVGMAEVTLVIDNADQRVNVAFSEIEVSRRLFRSGESEYLINGARARLKDIDALLASTGLRQDGYAVTAQNDIDYVIQAAPDVRRELIEEAAGVRRLRDQRQEAVNRLAEAERDMRRARDILNELAPRAEELRGQAAAAEEYQKLADSLKALQGSLARDAWRKAMVQLRRALSRLQAAEHKRSVTLQAIAEFEPRYAAHRQALQEARDARWRQQESLADLRLRLAEAQHRARIAEERTVAAVQALEALQRELGRLSASEQAGNRVVDEIERALTDVTAELDVALGAMKSAAETEAEARQKLSAAEERQAQLGEQRQELQRERLALDAEVRQLEGRLLFLKDQQQQLHHQLDAWSNRQGLLTDELAARRSQAENAERELSEILSRWTTVERELAQVDSSLETARRGMVEREAQLRSVEAELRALRTLLDGAQGRTTPPTTASWERLFELIEVEPRHRAAVEAALEGSLYGWVARDWDAFDEAAAALRGAESARETLFFALESSSPERPRDGLQPIVQLVSAPPPVLRILEQLLCGAVLAADRTDATRIVAAHPDLRAVTSGGEVITAVSYRGGSSADPVLTLQARIRDAETALDHERAASLAAAQEVEHLATERLRLLDERQLIGDQVNSARTRAAQAAGGLAASGEAMQREAVQETQLRQQLNRLTTLLEQAEQAQVAALDHQRTIAEREAAVGRELSGLSSEIEAAGDVLRGLMGSRQQRELEAALVRQRFEDLQRQLERAEQVRQGHGNDLSQRRAAEQELAVQPSLINEERRQWLERAQALTDEIAAVESLPLPDSAALAGLEAEVRDDEQRNVEFRVELAHADDALAAAAADRDAAQAEVDRCAGALREDGQQVSEADEPIAEVDWQKTEREVSRLQRRLEAMGAVNLLAPQEYAQVRERCDTLADQLADLEQASAQLTELRQRLEAEIDSRFRTVFQAVAVNFQEFFGELFEGGRATLRLESQADGNPLDDGVEILAQTPGKRLQPLTLLSGGERALTALAFLFALQAVNPSPFYVLDEVDAALDDANVVRFNRVLRRLAAAQQFLLVTHNHSTMAQAEALYGVTLGEHGISRIVSVRLQQDNLVPVGERTA